MSLIPISYHGLEYPSHINARIKEVAGHFDKDSIPNDIEDNKFSLHTEYSAKKRNFTSQLIKQFPTILESQGEGKSSKPKLWISDDWSREFAYFIIKLVEDKTPHIIEIHPPNARVNFKHFSRRYKIFYDVLRLNGIASKILIENRNGFSLSKTSDFQMYSDLIDEHNLDLKLILDFPQLLNAEQAKEDITKLEHTMNTIDAFKHNVDAFHIWGQVQRNAHMGDLNDYFNGSRPIKDVFLNSLANLFVESDKDIYFIPEINAGNGDCKHKDCLSNIVNDLEGVGFKFE